MRATEFITERMDISWIRNWVQRSAPANMPSGKNLEWFSKFFKALNSDPEFKKWAKENVNGPISIKHKLIDNPNISLSVIDAEHVVYDNPTTHQIVAGINVAPSIDNDKKLTDFINRMSARLTHELNHAHQVSQQLNKTDNPDTVYDREDRVFKKEPPPPRNKTEEYYQYMLDHLEKDAWASEIAQDIKNVLGADSIKNLENVFKQAEKEDYAVIGSKILQVPNLNGLYSAIKFYGNFLKLGPIKTWQKVKKEIYRYIAQ